MQAHEDSFFHLKSFEYKYIQLVTKVALYFNFTFNKFNWNNLVHEGMKYVLRDK